ncbi:MAG TPA: helix-turn-helix transcriptional regulator [Candidatus Methylacidiphilales bacterium]|nr:helix-turn-helix transcriptional regulator [Candidatus Methylacidiphilales bacterium]
MANVGSRIRSLRLERRMTLPALADKAGLSKGLLSKLENAETPNPSLETLQKIAEALKVTLSDILDSGRIVMKKVVLPESPPWLQTLKTRLQQDGIAPDEDILQALLVLQSRKASRSDDDASWYLRYKNLELSFRK